MVTIAHRKPRVKSITTKILKQVMESGFASNGAPYATSDVGTDFGPIYDELFDEYTRRLLKLDEKHTRKWEREKYEEFLHTVGKWCPQCDEVKPMNEEHWHKRAKPDKGFRSYCRVCRNKLSKVSKLPQAPF